MEEFKYYTMFGVRLEHGSDMVPVYSRDFILRWTTNERNSFGLAKAISSDEIFKTSVEDAIMMTGVQSECYSFEGIRKRLQHCPEITAHLFETDYVLTDDCVKILIDSANKCSHGKELLSKAIIKL